MGWFKYIIGFIFYIGMIIVTIAFFIWVIGLLLEDEDKPEVDNTKICERFEFVDSSHYFEGAEFFDYNSDEGITFEEIKNRTVIVDYKFNSDKYWSNVCRSKVREVFGVGWRIGMYGEITTFDTNLTDNSLTLRCEGSVAPKDAVDVVHYEKSFPIGADEYDNKPPFIGIEVSNIENERFIIESRNVYYQVTMFIPKSRCVD